MIKVSIDRCPFHLLFHLFRSAFEPLSLLISTERGRHGQICCKEGTLKEEGKNETVEVASLQQLTFPVAAEAVSVTLLLSSAKVVVARTQEGSSPKTGASRQRLVE